MRKFLCASLLVIAMSPAAFAQTPTTPATTGAATHTPGGAGPNFEARKTKLVAKLQEKLTCVQAATDGRQLEACFPKRGEKGGERAIDAE